MSAEAIMEGILFAMGNSVDKQTLADSMELSIAEVERCAESLSRMYEDENRGIRLIRLGDCYQLCTKEECYEALIRIAVKPKKPALTDIVMETLAIIAYKQPITKQEIEKIRGVSSDHAVNRLVEYGLVCEAGRLNAPGRPILFATTEEFLRRFRIADLEELPEPDAEKLAEIAREVEAETASEDAEKLLQVNV